MAGVGIDLKSPIVRLVAVTIIAHTSLFAVRPMVSYRALALGASPLQLGIVTGSFSLLSLFVALSAGRWVDRRQEGEAILAGTVVMSAASLGLALAGSLPALIVLQAVLGCAQILNVVGLQTMIANRGPGSDRDRRFAIFTTSVTVGQLLGPALAGQLAGAVGGTPGTTGAQAVFLAAAGCCLVATAASIPLLIRGRRPTPRKASDPRRGMFAVLSIRSMPEAILVSLTVLSAVEIMTTYLPAYGEVKGYSVQEVSLLLSTRAAASLCSRFLMTTLIRIAGHKTVLAVSTLVPGVLVCTWPLIDSLPLLFASMVVVGFGLGLGQPITMTWVANRVAVQTRGAALALRLTANRLGQMTIPISVGGIAGAAGIMSIFYCMAGLLAVSAAATASAEFEDVNRA
jgi:MFS family permease